MLMINKLKSSQLKYLSIRYLRKYIKLPVLLFTLLIFEDSFSESRNYKQRLKGFYWKRYKVCIKEKLFFIRLFQNCSLQKYILKLTHSKNKFSKIINLIALIYFSTDSSEGEKSLQLSLMCLLVFCQCIYTLLKTFADNNFHLFW